MNNREKIKRFCKENNLEIDLLKCQKASLSNFLPCSWCLFLEDGNYYESDICEDSVDIAVDKMLIEINIDYNLVKYE